jgi:hypothetical protein
MRASSFWQRLASQRISRRRALKAGLAAGLGMASFGLAGCGEEKEPLEPTKTPSVEGEPLVRQELVPSNDTIYADIQQIFAQGVRRPGYPADRWTEQFCLQRFNDLGLEHVRTEPVEAAYWEPRDWSLSVWGESPGSAQGLDLECFPLPHSAPTSGLEDELVAFDAQSPTLAEGGIALQDVALMHVPHAYLANLATWCYDPEGTFANSVQVLPFSAQFQGVMEPVMAAGASGFVGALTGYPSDSHEYYVPYDGVARPIPGVWISGSDGVRLREMLAAGPVRARLRVDSIRQAITCNNIVGELAGADDEWVIIGSHHDGPWSSAVEDGSGTSLVLAQAGYWSQVPQEERPHRLVFTVNAGHMVGGAGTRAFIEAHRADLTRTVLEVHLEHAAMEYVEEDGRLRQTGYPEARWWFTSRISRLQAAVQAAIEAEGLARSLILPPAALGDRPPTDGGAFYPAGVPIVDFLTAPFYLFDAQDTLDKIDREHLAAITRVAIRIVGSTRGVTAASMREGMQ